MGCRQRRARLARTRTSLPVRHENTAARDVRLGVANPTNPRAIFSPVPLERHGRRRGVGAGGRFMDRLWIMSLEHAAEWIRLEQARWRGARLFRAPNSDRYACLHSFRHYDDAFPDSRQRPPRSFCPSTFFRKHDLLSIDEERRSSSIAGTAPTRSSPALLVLQRDPSAPRLGSSWRGVVVRHRT